MKSKTVSDQATARFAEDTALASRFTELLNAAQAADQALRTAQAERAPLAEQRTLALALDTALTDAMRAAYAAQRAEIGPRGYEDRIFNRKAKAKPAVRALTAEAERLLTLRENHRLNRIPEVPHVPAV